MWLASPPFVEVWILFFPNPNSDSLYFCSFAFPSFLVCRFIFPQEKSFSWQESGLSYASQKLRTPILPAVFTQPHGIFFTKPAFFPCHYIPLLFPPFSSPFSPKSGIPRQGPPPISFSFYLPSSQIRPRPPPPFFSEKPLS